MKEAPARAPEPDREPQSELAPPPPMPPAAEQLLPRVEHQDAPTEPADARVGALAAACGGSLRRLNLNACQALTDAAVEAVAERCPLLESLSLYWDVRIGEGWLLARRAEEMHAN